MRFGRKGEGRGEEMTKKRWIFKVRSNLILSLHTEQIQRQEGSKSSVYDLRVLFKTVG